MNVQDEQKHGKWNDSVVGKKRKEGKALTGT
jgi:hypothetical protein